MDVLILLLLALLGLVIGGLIGWLLGSKGGITKVDLTENYVPKSAHLLVQERVSELQTEQQQREQELRSLHGELAGLEEKLSHLRQAATQQETLQQQAALHFESIANRLLDEKSAKFTLSNQQQLGHLLGPLQEKINSFSQQIDQKFIDEGKDRVSLKKEIELLRVLNSQLSNDANNLANALKGDNKMQGDWGELQLATLLEKAGLEKEIHYRAQPSYKDDHGAIKRPDFIIDLPEGKHLIIDCKVSLKAYEVWTRAESESERQQALRNHLISVKGHVKNLKSKEYTKLYDLHSMDYLLLFIPIEPAFTLAIREDHSLFTDALESNIVLVSPTTLMATMRTVSYIWKQDKQQQNVLEIAHQSGLLYDRFVSFVEDLQKIGERLEQAQTSYSKAMDRLKTGSKPGNTLIGRAERIKELGAKASKSMPAELL